MYLPFSDFIWSDLNFERFMKLILLSESNTQPTREQINTKSTEVEQRNENHSSGKFIVCFYLQNNILNVFSFM